MNVEEESSEKPGKDAEEGDHSQSLVHSTKELLFQRRFYLKARRLELSPSGRTSGLRRKSSSCRREDGAEELVHAAPLVDERLVLLEHLQETREPRLELLADEPRLSPPSASSWRDR